MAPHRLLRAFALGFALSPNVSGAAPACIPPVEVAHAKAVRVEKNGVIVIADGRAARLEGILLPSGVTDHAPQVFADRSLAALNDIVKDHWLSLAAGSPREDRYGRIRAQILVKSDGDASWVQRTILGKGLARVAITPDRNECTEELYAAEAEARRGRIGIWSSAAYAVRSPLRVDDDVGTFQIVEGTVVSVSRSGSRVFLDFGPQGGFAATISPDDMKRFREIGVDPFAYANAVVRVRGWIERISRRPEIGLATPAQVEIVHAPPNGAAP